MPEDIGALLRDARERSGVSLRDIATRTKISMQTLEALERNDVSRLPGGIFLRAFVRAFAKEVGLDPEDTVKRFVARFPDAAVEDTTALSYLPAPEHPVIDDDRPANRVWRVVGWSLPLILVIVYFGFGGRLTWLREQVRPSAPRVDVQPEQAPPGPSTPVMATPAVSPSTTPAATSPEGAPAGAGAVPAAAVDAQPAADTAARPTAQAASLTTPPAPSSNTGGTGHDAPAITGPPAEGRFTMLLAPKGKCWVTVRSNGSVVFSGTMNPGDRQSLVVGGNVSFTVGDAAAMAFEINGKPGRNLGAAGQVATVLLTAQNLKDFEAR